MYGFMQKSFGYDLCVVIAYAKIPHCMTTLMAIVY